MTDGYDALLLVSFGGPEGPDDVLPFLEHVTRGRGVPPERLEEVAHHYRALGGVSPINGQNRALLAALRAELDARGVDLPLVLGNRNWDPYLAPVLAGLHAEGHRRVLALTTSVYSSYSSCRQYREDLARAAGEAGIAGELHVDRVRQAFDHPGFVAPFVEGIAAALDELAREGIPPVLTRLVFTTHSIPTAMADSSGPPDGFGPGGAYVAQHRAAIGAVLAALAWEGTDAPAATLAYQSRSGSPLTPWLEPDVNDALHGIRDEGARAVIVVPIGFVSDHVEVVWDLDHEAAETCEAVGLRMVRVATPGTHPAFVRGLADLVEERLRGTPPHSLSPLGPWPAVCAAGCCPNLQGPLPALAGLD